MKNVVLTSAKVRRHVATNRVPRQFAPPVDFQLHWHLSMHLLAMIIKGVNIYKGNSTSKQTCSLKLYQFSQQNRKESIYIASLVYWPLAPDYEHPNAAATIKRLCHRRASAKSRAHRWRHMSE